MAAAYGDAAGETGDPATPFFRLAEEAPRGGVLQVWRELAINAPYDSSFM